MKGLIIGSDSFIAKKFIAKYSEDNIIKGITRKSTGFRNEIVVTDYHHIGKHCFENIDIVINFIAIVHRPDIKDINLYDLINHKLSVRNAFLAKSSGVEHFIQMSTIAVYGNKSEISIHTTCDPDSIYSSSKYKADIELLTMQDEYFKVTIVRPPMVYGGGNAPGNMMRLINLVYKRVPLPFKGINNKRDFINVNNLIQYLHVIAEKELNGIQLLTDGEPVSTEYLILTISRLLKKKALLISPPYWLLNLLKQIKPDEYNKLTGSLKIRSNFMQEELIKKYTVEQGIKEMVEAYIQNK